MVVVPDARQRTAHIRRDLRRSWVSEDMEKERAAGYNLDSIGKGSLVGRSLLGRWLFT